MEDGDSFFNSFQGGVFFQLSIATQLAFVNTMERSGDDSYPSRPTVIGFIRAKEYKNRQCHQDQQSWSSGERILESRPRRCRRTIAGSLWLSMVCFLSHLFLVFLVDNSSYAFSPSNHSSKRPTRCHTAAFQTASNHHTNGEATSSNSSILKVPAHVAFICDGNSRWAKARRLPSVAGHAAGGNRLIQIVDALKRKGVSHATFYGFSTENWQRTASEVQDILKVLEGTARQFYGKALQDNLRIRILGDLQDERIPSGLRDILHRLEVDTGGSDDYMRDDNDDRLTLTIAINYGGRQDIVNASKRMALAIAREGDSLDLDTVTEETFATYLGTAGIPDPDFVIRTSGECRLSNFLLWNVAYAELYFVETLWPDFDEASLDEAFEWYAQRKRRFGARQMTKETSRA